MYNMESYEILYNCLLYDFFTIKIMKERIAYMAIFRLKSTIICYNIIYKIKYRRMDYPMEKYYFLGNGERNLLSSTKDINKYDYDDTSFNFDINRKNDSHMAIIRQIEPKSEVLDIGCASGFLGVLLNHYRNCIVDGIEYDKEAIEIARKKNAYRDLFHFSIVDDKSKEYISFMSLKKKYDYIVFGDVLEHLVNPWDALKGVSNLLKENGSIIISLPNIGNLDIIRALINGEFNYQNVGVMDTTHLRFFTSNSFVDMIENISKEYQIYYNIELCETIQFTPPYFNDEKIYDLFRTDDRNIEEFLVLQNIFKLTLSNDKKIKIKGIKKENNYFQKISDNIEKHCKEVENLTEENKLLKEESALLKKESEKREMEMQALITKYEVIVNSKGWKLLEKVRKVKNSIKK